MTPQEMLDRLNAMFREIGLSEEKPEIREGDEYDQKNLGIGA